jgi:DNA-binding transcriptional regulator YdaS (Cro superfamily)
MTLNEYLSKPGLAADLARSIGVSAVLVSQWKNMSRPIPAQRCLEIEKATLGAVRCEELRPDIDWAYLRNSQNSEAA